jgi:hypothetical protein
MAVECEQTVAAADDNISFAAVSFWFNQQLKIRFVCLGLFHSPWDHGCSSRLSQGGVAPTHATALHCTAGRFAN